MIYWRKKKYNFIFTIIILLEEKYDVILFDRFISMVQIYTKLGITNGLNCL